MSLTFGSSNKSLNLSASDDNVSNLVFNHFSGQQFRTISNISPKKPCCSEKMVRSLHIWVKFLSICSECDITMERANKNDFQEKGKNCAPSSRLTLAILKPNVRIRACFCCQLILVLRCYTLFLKISSTTQRLDHTYDVVGGIRFRFYNKTWNASMFSFLLSFHFYSHSGRASCIFVKLSYYFKQIEYYAAIRFSSLLFAHVASSIKIVS